MSAKGSSQPFEDTKGRGELEKGDDNDDRHYHKRKNEDDEEGSGLGGGKGEEKRPKKTIGGVMPISMKLGQFQAVAAAAKKSELKTVPTSGLVANVFGNDDDDEEEEEMPPEAKMRMRNMGRDTPTSTGPNSFGKTRQGFCDSRKGFDKSDNKKKSDVVSGHGRRHE